MMRDQTRVPAYAAAIASTVRPGDVVLDLGAGAGIFTILATRAGAARVYAVETSDVVDLTRRAAREAGVAERVVCIQGDSRRVDLPERAAVLVCDIRGALPILANSLEVIADARERLLAPGARMIPRADTIFLAPVESAEGFAAVWGWRDPMADVDFSSVAEMAANTWRREPLEPTDLLAPGKAVARLDYTAISSFDLEMSASFEVERSGSCNGIGGWFEAELADGVALSSAPEVGPTIYGHAYFPLSYAHAVATGDRVEVDVEAKQVGGKHVWLWNVRIERREAASVEERHSSFRGELVNLEALRRRSADFVPALGRDGEV
jgi:protein arginine N-methyltransferase 1